MQERRFSLAFLLGTALVLVLVYRSSLQYGFHYDDFHSLVQNPHIRRLSNVPAFFLEPGMFSGTAGRGMYRPLVLVSYALNYRAGGYGAWGYHLVNLGLHLACAFLVYLLGKALHGRGEAAALGALLFALHPVNAEVVNYVSSRSESLAGLGHLTALWAYLRWRQEGRTGFFWLSLAAGAGGLLSKSTVVTLPAALLWYEWWNASAKGGRGSRLWPWHLAYWAVVAGYLLAARGWLQTSLSSSVRSVGEQLPTQVKAAVYYLQLLAVPVRLSVEHPFSVSRSLAELQVLLPLALLASGLYLLWRARRGLWVGWGVLPLLPASLVPLNVLVNEHRLYLPVAFLGAGAGLLLAGLLPQGKKWLVGAGLLAAMGLLAHQRSAVWKDELSLWSDAVRKAPGMYRAHMHLGGALEQRGRIQEALTRYRRAAELGPEVVEAHYNLGNALRLLGRREEAVAAYERSLDLNEAFAPALVNLSSMHLESGQSDRAEDLLVRALEAQPEFPEAHRQFGILCKQQGRSREAEAAYLRALALRPDWAKVHYNLANLYFDAGRLPEAIRRYEWALVVQSDHAGAYRNLADLYMRQGDYARAAEVYARGLRHVPDEAVLYYGLAKAQDALGQRQAAADSYRRFLQHARVGPEVEGSIRQRIRELEEDRP